MLDSLKRRPRGRSFVELKWRLTESAATREGRFRDRLEALAPLEGIPLERSVRLPATVPGSVTRMLAEQLGDWEPDLGALDPEIHGAWEHASEAERPYLRVMLAVWQDAPGFCERSGLVRADPPEGVHAMARGPLAAGGGLNAADVVADALRQAGVPPAAGDRALDFGGSSGRVVRVMRAAFPATEWHSCDPNAEAVAWAARNIPGVRFHVSPEHPPLDVLDGHFDLVYAVSVWSHLSESAASSWFDEMHRAIRPGGILLVTVQSFETVHDLGIKGLYSLRRLREAVADLYRTGHHFRAVFGPEGDFGVRNPDWGFAYLSAEWLVRRLTPAWGVLLWRVGALEGNQDVVVLQRR